MRGAQETDVARVQRWCREKARAQVRVFDGRGVPCAVAVGDGRAVDAVSDRPAALYEQAIPLAVP